MKIGIILGLLINLSFGEFPIATSPEDDVKPKVATLGEDIVVVYKQYVPGIGYKLRAVRVNGKTGEKIWDVWVVDDSFSEGAHQIIVNEHRMIWIVFERTREYPPVIGLQKLSSNGERLLGKDGIDISSDPNKKKTPHLCLSPEGGVWCIWMDFRPGDLWVYLAKITEKGEIAFQMPVCSIPSPRWNPALIPSGKGIIVLWGGKEYDTTGVYANRIAGNNFLWGERGRLILPYPSSMQIKEANLQSQYPFPYATSDSLGGVYTFPADFYKSGVQRVDSLGNLLFDSIPQVNIPYSLTATEDHGVVGCYSYTGGADLYQHVDGVKVDSSGILPWGYPLRIWTSPIIDTAYHEPHCSVMGDYRGGCIVAIGGWQTKEEKDIIVVHVDSSGKVGEPIIICDAPQDQQNPVIIQNPSTKGYLVVWEDFRNGNWDIYGIALDSLLRPGIEEGTTSKPLLFSLSSTPNPFAQLSAISYQLTAPSYVKLNVYNASGQLVKTLIEGEENSGSHRVFWNGEDEGNKISPSGIYFYELTAKSDRGTQREIRKVVLLRR